MTTPDLNTLPNIAADNASPYPITPKRFRLFFAVLLIVLLGAIWTSALHGVETFRANIAQTLKKGLLSEAVILESHAARTLESIAARLESANAMTATQGPAARLPPTEELKQLIYDDRAIRSISLVDPFLKIVTSSVASNVGVTLPPGTLPEAVPGSRRPGPIYGKVFNARDLNEIARETDPKASSTFWLVALPTTMDGQTFHWVIAINTTLFQNLWERTLDDPSIRVMMFGYAGQLIIADNTDILVDPSRLGPEVISHFRTQQKGLFTAGQAQQLLVSYRGSTDYPFVLAVIGDLNVLWKQNGEVIERYLWVAAVLSLFALGFMAYLYHWYLRYEASATELSNQARAMGAHLIISESDQDGHITSVNQAFLDVSGYTRAEVIGKNHRMFNTGLYPKDFYRNLWMTISSGHIWRGTFRNLSKARSYYWLQATIVPFTDAWGRISRYVALYTDITDAIAHSESAERERRLRENLSRINEELASDANTDALTGLPNRRAFSAFADRMFRMERDASHPISALMIDLDFFKTINDSYGHEAGDQVLIELTRRWEKFVRSSDMLARIGGEEFCVLLNDSSSNQAMIVAEKFRIAAASLPVTYQSLQSRPQEIPVTVSIGIATATSLDGVLVDDLMRVADVALYEAKNTGRDHVVARALN